MTSAPTIGLARLPHGVRRLLDDAADNAAAAAIVFEHLTHTRDPSALDELERLELEGDRITRDLIHALRNSRLASDERGRLLALAQAVDDTIDALENAGREALHCDCGNHTRPIAGVIRDVVRTQARAVHQLTAQIALDDDMTGGLPAEGRRVLRRALAEASNADGEPLLAIRRTSCIKQFERSFTASVRAVKTVERTNATAR